METVAITAGHSNTDPGAVNGKRTEAQIVLDMRKMVAHYLMLAGVKFETDGADGVNQPLSRAIGVAARNDLAIEFHCNAAESASAKGVEVLAAPKHKRIAQDLAKAVAETLGTTLRGDGGFKPENSGQHSRLGFISKGGGMIVELFFISNPVELAAWDAKKWLVAKNVAKVIIDEVKK